jgi:hypothetical protein
MVAAGMRGKAAAHASEPKYTWVTGVGRLVLYEPSVVKQPWCALLVIGSIYPIEITR